MTKRYQYIVRYNGTYMNAFPTYGEAVDLVERELRRFPKARLRIECEEWYEMDDFEEEE